MDNHKEPIIPMFDRYYLYGLLIPIELIWLISVIHFEKVASLIENISMTLVMVFGSFIAGATSEGGGAIAFPVMTLGFGIPPESARNFSLTIQSIGMTAASFVIIRNKINIEWNAIKWGGTGGVIGVCIGAYVLAPYITGGWAKLFFTSLWFSFSFVLFFLNRKDRHTYKNIDHPNRWDNLILILVGLTGGLISSVTGSGIDMFMFSVLTLRYRIGEEVATPTSVILMSLISISGAILHGFYMKDLSKEEVDYLIACIPVVIIGAPFGAWYIKTKSRLFIAKLLCSILVIQHIVAYIVLTPSLYLTLFSIFVSAMGICIFYAFAMSGRNRLCRKESCSV